MRCDDNHHHCNDSSSNMSPYSQSITAEQQQKVENDAPALAFEELYKMVPETAPGRVLYISRHGESLFNLENRIGGNPDLSPQGFKYARALGAHVNSLAIPDLKVWTSELMRTQQTSEHIDAPKIRMAELNELDSGKFDDLTYEEFEERFPDEFRDREINKLSFRYPGGESYLDVCRRIEPILPQMDEEHNLLVICHQAVIRCVMAFLMRLPAEEVPYIKVPLHCILKVTFSEGKNRVEYHHLPIECVDTYRPKMDLADLVKIDCSSNSNKTEKTEAATAAEDDDDLLLLDMTY